MVKPWRYDNDRESYFRDYLIVIRPFREYAARINRDIIKNPIAINIWYSGAKYVDMSIMRRDIKTIDEFMESVDQKLIDNGYTLLSYSQVKQFEILV